MTQEQEIRSLIEELAAAFRGVKPGRISLHEAEVIDDYGTDEQCRDARERDTETQWEQVPDAHIERCTTALCHLDPAGWRFYVPAYIRWTLGHFRTSFSIVSDFTIYTFDPSMTPDLHAYSMERFATLDAAQSRVVCRFLRFMARQGDWADDVVARRALDHYWGRFDRRAED